MSYYVVRQKIDKRGENEGMCYHGVPVASGQAGMDELTKDKCTDNAAISLGRSLLTKFERRHIRRGYVYKVTEIKLMPAKARGFYSTA